MSRPDFAALLKQDIGLDIASIGSTAVDRAVQAGILRSGAADAQAYWDLVRDSRREWQELVDAIVVPETWCFRDREAFSAMLHMVQDEWLPAHADGKVRLLSVPCSTGEEPYSMAMALMDSGVPAGRYAIDAVDVCAKSITRAREALYGKNSFREADLEYRDRYFAAAGRGHRLREAVRQQVRFHQGNIFALDQVLGAQTYDVIFCRNLLIYFDPDTQARAIQLLHRRLAPDGVLFVAPSEAGLPLEQDFVATRIPRAFAFRKRADEPAPRLQATPPVVVCLPRPPAPRPVPIDRPVVAVAVQADAGASLREASRLADAGRLSEAAQHCAAHLGEQGASAQGFHLLGLINAAAGNLTIADGFFRRALYLDQSHADSLIHLALLLEKRGDTAGARQLRNRMARLEARGAK